MLKRLGATLAPSSSASNPPASLSPSHSSTSLDRIPAGGGPAASYTRYSHHPAHHHDLDTSHSTANYPRPSGMSTPYGSSPGLDPSPTAGYFGPIMHPSSSHGGLSPSLHATSRNASPVPSPRLDSPYPTSSNAVSSTPLDLNNNNWATTTPPNPIDRPTLQKSLKCLETLLVAMDEYRELSSRLAKVEKRLAKAGRELAASMGDGNNGATNKSREPYSILSSLSTTSTLFDSLSEISTKFSRHLAREYDLINEIIGKTFKKIAKEERIQDDLIETLDMKLKKANYTYDKKIRSSLQVVSNQSHQKIHEQFVPILSNLTEEIAKSKLSHNNSMAIKREFIVKEVCRSLTCLSEIEFRRNCEIVKKLGGIIGNVLAVQALLGPSNTPSNGGIGKNGHASMEQMPWCWPSDLTDIDELGRIQASVNDGTAQSQEKHENIAKLQGHVHPLASLHPSSSRSGSSSPSISEQQHRNISSEVGGRTLDDLMPPRAPFTIDPERTVPSRSRTGSDTSFPQNSNNRLPSPIPPHPSSGPNRTYSNLSTTTSGSSPSSTLNVSSVPRSASLNHLIDQESTPRGSSSGGGTSDRYGHLSVKGGGNGDEKYHQTGGNGMRSVSFPVEQIYHHHDSSVIMDHDATVTQRNVNSKPIVDTSFFPESLKTTQRMARNEQVGHTETSPTLRDNENARITPLLQPALSYSPSQSGKVGYFPDNDNRHKTRHSQEKISEKGHHDGENSRTTLPTGFVIEETSPEQDLNKRHLQTKSYESRSSVSSSNSLGDSPTLSLGTTGADTSATSYSRNFESYTSPPHHPSSNSREEKGSGMNNQEEDKNDGNKERRQTHGDGGGGGAQLERSLSIESTASEKSFVARMKARYAEEKQQARLQSNSPQSQSRQRIDHNENSTISGSGNKHGRRVSTIAQKWEEKASSSSVSSLSSGRPALSSLNQQHRASMPVIPSSSTTHWTPSSSRNARKNKPDMPRFHSTDINTQSGGEKNPLCQMWM